MSRLSALARATTIALTDIFHLAFDPTVTNVDKGITASNLRKFMSPEFNVLDYGAVGDGVTDDYTAVMAAHTAASLTGGDVYFPPGKTYRINSQFILPNDGSATPKQRPIRWIGGGSLWTGQGGAPYGGSIIDLRYSGSGAKIETYGLGLFEITGVTLTDFGTSSNAFVKTTNTTLLPHHMSIVGNAAKSGASCDQDAFILGGTALVVDGTSNAPFQGYGTIIEKCYFSHIRRGVYFQTYANSVVVRDNTWWNTCGGAAAIEMLGVSSNYCTGNVIADNLIECINYTYGIKLTYATGCSFITNNFFDATGVTAFFRFEASGIYNLIIAGYSTDTTTLVSDASGGTNTVINPHQSQTSNFAQLVTFANTTTFANPIVAAAAGGASSILVQPSASNSQSTLLLNILRSALEGTNPGTAIFQVQQNGTVTIGGVSAGAINFVDQTGATVAQFTSALKNWILSGSGGAMSQDSGTGGSYFTMKNFGVKFQDHNGGPLRVIIGAGLDGIKFGASSDANIYRSAANVLKTDSLLVGALGVVTNTGATGSRPASPLAGQMFYDTTLSKPIWYNGSNWKDATGATV
jgi:hypothetical protein